MKVLPLYLKMNEGHNIILFHCVICLEALCAGMFPGETAEEWIQAVSQ
jgi:hypothetical protein